MAKLESAASFEIKSRILHLLTATLTSSKLLVGSFGADEVKLG
ncbi:hypothetical protein [Helicobacter cinaedi]|nr:hypothetical protein [Helicobacter cinaedi]